MSEISQALEQVLPYLDVLTPDDYKGQILDHILGMSGTADGIKQTIDNKKLIYKLTDLVCHDKSDKIRLESLRILVNLSSTTCTVHKDLLDEDFVYFLLAAVVHKDLDCGDLIAMLLTNITQSTKNCQKVADRLSTHDQVTVAKLVEAFSDTSYNSKKCTLHHLGAFLSNLSLLRDVRLTLLKDEKLIASILPFTQFHESVTRRHAAASILKNCLFETDLHEWLLNDVGILPHLLLPLAGSGETLDEEDNETLPIDLQYLPPDKVREPNTEIKNMLLESLFSLCATTKCRLLMKKNGTYFIVRELHKVTDENDPIMTALENIVHILIGDEPEIEVENENLRDLQIPLDIEKKFEKLAA